MKNEGELSTGCCIYQNDVYTRIYTCIKIQSYHIVYMVIHMMIYIFKVHFSTLFHINVQICYEYI